MITIKDLTVKNFMSVGNVTQAVRFTDNGLTLVLGNNVDLGGDGSRNGYRQDYYYKCTQLRHIRKCINKHSQRQPNKQNQW